MFNQIAFVIVMFSAVASFGAQGSGIFLQANASQGKMKGDKIVQFPGGAFGSEDGDSIRFIINGQELADINRYTVISTYPIDFQYAVRYSFLAGYEKSFNKVLSIKGAIGYQYALLDANAATVNPDFSEDPFVASEIDRHWLNIPVDIKVTLPIRRSGLYLAAGPKASILLSSTYKDSLSNYELDLGDLTPRFNLSLGFRFGVELAIARAGFLLIESGYHKGLINLSPVSSVKTQEGEFVPISLGFRMNVPPEKN